MASSLSQNDSDRSLPGSVRLSKRSTEMKPGIFSSSARKGGGDAEIFLAPPIGRPDLEDDGVHGLYLPPVTSMRVPVT